MVKKLIQICAMACAALPAWGGEAEVKSLPEPVMTGGMPLMQAIAQRKSSRDFDPEKAVDAQTLSEVLWVAWGMNARGTRTIPTSRNLQNMALYVLTPEGCWLYDGPGHSLRKVNDKNLIPLCERQDFVKNAPLHLLYVIKIDRGGQNHVGSAYQNVYLYATSRGLSTVIRAMIDIPALNRELGLPADYTAVVHQCLGWPKSN